MDFENQPSITIKFKKHIWLIITIVLAGILFWQFGFKTLEKNIYNLEITATTTNDK
jgi:hypothetical protein